MADKFDDAIVAKPTTDDGGGRGFSRGTIVQETIEEGSTISHRDDDAVGEDMGRKLPDGVLAKIDSFGKKAAAAPKEETTEEPTGEEDPPEETPPEGDPPKEDEPIAAKEGEEKKPDPKADEKPAPKDPLADNLVRLQAANAKLVEEVEQLRTARAQHPPSLLEEAERHYYEADAITGIRHVLAAFLGVEKPDDPKVEAELRDLYLDLTAKEVGVTLDSAQQAKREAARTRQLLDREKRQRKADEQKKANEGQRDADTKKADDAAAFIAPRLSQKASDYPLLTSLAEVFDGMKPEQLVWKVLERESKTGRIAITNDDDANIANAAKLVEEHYAGLVDRVSKAKPATNPKPPSTAKPTDKAAVTSASKDNAPKPRGANLTTADASVAPATPPAKPEAKKDQPPKFKSNEERKQWALRHLAD